MRILISTPDQFLTDILQEYLKKKGYEADTSDLTPEILKSKISFVSPSIVILSMPLFLKAVWKTYDTVLQEYPETCYLLLVKEEDPLILKQISESTIISGISHEADGVLGLLECIEAAQGGERYLSPFIRRCITMIDRQLFASLTITEKRIVYLILEGYKTEEIAEIMFRSVDTIKTHRRSIKMKLGITGGKKALMEGLSELITL